MGLLSVFLCAGVSLVLASAAGWTSGAWVVGLLWAACGGWRGYERDVGLIADCVVFGLLNIMHGRRALTANIVKRWDADIWWSRWSLAGFVVGIASIGVFLHRARGSGNADSESSTILPQGAEKWLMDHPRARIFPCRTTHARVFPKRHAFGHSYLLYGLPIIPAGTRNGEDVTDGRDRVLGSWWLRVRADDYLERGYGELGFYGKLKKFLQDKGVQDSEWSYAYLVTAPRFFGYSFNPVSFWYIYGRQHELQRMILEVNNTFGERRLYLLEGTCPPSPSQSSVLEDSNVSVPDPLKQQFTDKWMKDFHVSPFNSRKGSYALKALNPFPHPCFSEPKVDNTITLKSSKDYAKIVARVYATGKSLDPGKLGMLGTLRFIGGWWWVGFVTFPRILKEAFKLFFARSLHVWFRPEVMPSSVGQMPASTEIALQMAFQDYLQFLVNQSEEGFRINYYTAIPDHPQSLIATTHCSGLEFAHDKLEIRVLVPVFYSRLVHYAHIREAFDRECLFTDEKNRTILIPQPKLLATIIPNPTRSTPQVIPGKRSCLDEIRWNFMRKLRCPPAEPAYPITPRSNEFEIDDIRSLPFSELDHFVRGPQGSHHAGKYRRIATKLFLAQRFAFGFAEIVDLVDFALRLLLCYVGSQRFSAWAQELSQQSCIGSSAGSATCVGEHEGELAEWWWTSRVALWVCSCHFYGLLKGYR